MKDQEEPRQTRVVKQRFVAAAESGPHPLALRRATPAGCGCDGSLVGGKSNQHAVVRVALAHKLADVQLARPPQLGGARVAEVRIVFPHYDFGDAVVPLQMFLQRLECFGHVPVAQIPR